MKKIILFLRLLSMLAFVPVLYFLVNDNMDNIIYYIAILIVVFSFFTIQLLQWKMGEREKVKKTMTAIGFMAVAMFLMVFIFFR